MNITFTLPGVLGVLIPFVYVFTHMGAREHEGWLWSRQTLLIAILSTILFCIGADGVGIWHMLTGGAQ